MAPSRSRHRSSFENVVKVTDPTSSTEHPLGRGLGRIMKMLVRSPVPAAQRSPIRSRQKLSYENVVQITDPTSHREHPLGRDIVEL